MNRRRYNGLIAKRATLVARLEKGMTVDKPGADELFVKLLREYEAVHDELREVEGLRDLEAEGISPRQSSA